MSESDLLQQAKKQTALLALDYQMHAQKQKQSKMSWRIFFGAFIVLIVTRYLALKTEYKEVFDWIKSNPQSYACALGNFTGWQIALNISYPWLGHLVLEDPITQYSARFLWYVIYNNLIPTQKEIDDKFPGKGLTPLDYLCGNIASEFYTDSKTPIADAEAAVKKDASNTPWWKTFTSTSNLIDGFHDAELQIFLSQGFYGLAKWAESGQTSANDLYTIVYGKTPKKPCNSSKQILNTVTGISTGLMAGAAFGPVGSLVGGLVMGGLTFMGGSDDNANCS